MRTITVEPVETRRVGDQVRAAAEVRWPDGDRTHLWVELPVDRAGELADDADPWVLALLHAAMMRGLPLVVAGRVSPSLLDHLEDYQAAFEGWSRRPRWPGSAVYRRIDIEAEVLAERADPGREAVAAWSGGLDSTFSIARHVRNEVGHATRSIGAAVMVAGFDIPLDQPDTFERAADRAQRITDDLGVPLVRARTNLQALDLPWPEVFPAAVMSVLSHLGGRFGAGIVATGRRWDWLDLPDDGSSPAWDWALGSASFACRHDGADVDRPDKVAYLADWEVARRNVRVCWAGDQLDRNCGRCRKCVGTYLLFRCLGIPPDAFDDPPPDDELAELVRLPRPTWTIAHRYGESLLATARERGVDEPWVRSLERSLFRDRREQDLARARAVVQPRLAALDRHLAAVRSAARRRTTPER